MTIIDFSQIKDGDTIKELLEWYKKNKNELHQKYPISDEETKSLKEEKQIYKNKNIK